MITYFTEQDLVSFGSYLISPNRKKAYINYGIAEDKLTETMSVINPLDLTSWISFLQTSNNEAKKQE